MANIHSADHNPRINIETEASILCRFVQLFRWSFFSSILVFLQSVTLSLLFTKKSTLSVVAHHGPSCGREKQLVSEVNV